MTQNPFRIEQDSLGDIRVPKDALYGAQTQRAIQNFPISEMILPIPLIQTLALIKQAAALANQKLNILDPERANLIVEISEKIRTGFKSETEQYTYLELFPVDIFQTGSGTSSNMNLNEVISNLANRKNPELKIHPNDHVNLSQSSNDVFPSAIQISAACETQFKLLPALQTLSAQIDTLAQQFKSIPKTGRTHLMDAMPLTFGQELSGWQAQIEWARLQIAALLPELQELALGGTAIGTGINAPPNFAKIACDRIAQVTQIVFKPAKNYFAKISAQDAIVRLSGHLKALACALMKISNDLRWMNSGPLAGLSEIQLAPRQPGSSIMPGKVNPVIPESLCMICAQVIGNDMTITLAGQSGNFQLNTMLPLIGQQILYSLKILTNGCNMLALNGLTDLTINQKNIDKKLAQNPILITALTPILGYDLCAKIVKTAYKNDQSILDTALDMTDFTRAELEKLLDPKLLIRPQHTFPIPPMST